MVCCPFLHILHRREGIWLRAKTVATPRRSKTDLCEISSAINVKCVGIISCLVMNVMRMPPKSKKPYVLSYTHSEKLLLAFWPNSLGCHAPLPITGFDKLLQTLRSQTIAEDIQAIAFDEMWHFIQSKKENCGSLKPWIVAQGEPLPGYSVVVMLQHFNGSTINSNM